MEVFSAISQHIPVHLFLMNPCREYWADIASEREQFRIREKYKKWTTKPADLHLETGNPLLASMGTLGRDFFSAVTDFDHRVREHYEEPEPTHLLSCLQRDILYLTDPSSSGHPTEPSIETPDSSVQLHACHGPMREIEVLHDHLLAMFEAQPDLRPKDIIVMTPDIERYAPFVQAVFGTQTEASKQIPFSVADRSLQRESRVVDGFSSLLDLRNSRCGASQVLALLEFPEIRRKFGLSARDMEAVERWVQKVGIRWGMDANFRKDLDLPGYAENTWQQGVDRLLLGYAMPGSGRLLETILPFDHLEGHDGIVLGKLLDFLDCLFDAVRCMNTIETVRRWTEILHSLINRFVSANEETEREIQMLRDVLDELSQYVTVSGFEQPVSFEVVRSWLNHRLEKEGFGSGFITGGVTFCAMLPMRSIPFDVICLVGMNIDAFPREARKLGFDFISKYPKPGDRSRRVDDRYLFLEAILSARKTLYISYTGLNLQDNSILPPSVLVSELTDYIEEGYGIQESDLVIRHRLQAYSPKYFTADDHRMFSYSEENLVAANSLLEAKAPAAFFSQGLPEPDDAYKTIEINRMVTFFSSPAKFLIQNRLGIHIERQAPVIEDREHFNLDALQRHIIGRELVEYKVAGYRLRDFLPVYRASGELPHGTVGEVLFDELCLDAEMFVKRIDAFTGDEPVDPPVIRKDIAEFSLHAVLNQIYTDGFVHMRYANVQPTDLVGVWIHHLFLCLLNTDIYPQQSYAVGKDCIWLFSRVENSVEILSGLLELYWTGLQRPLHFFPGTSFEFTETLLVRNKPRDLALDRARARWLGNEYSPGESEDPYFHVCFKNTEVADIIDRTFEEQSVRFFEPLLKHGSKIR